MGGRVQKAVSRKWIAALAVAGLSASLSLWWLANDADAPRAEQTAAQESKPADAAVLPPVPALAPAPKLLQAVVLTAQDTEFLQRLRDKFGSRIQSKHAQIKGIEQLIAYLMAQYPDDWQARVHAFLQQLFPSLADALFAKFQGLMNYNAWLASHREALMQMSPGDRRAALWKARQEAFGADAQEIFAAQLRAERLQDSLAAMGSAEGLSVEQRLAGYMTAVKEVYGDDAGALLETRQNELMNHFLDVESVQSDLRRMPPEERGAALRKVREAMGMDEAALQRWDQLDQHRDEIWTAGQQYMQERQQIASQYDGAERQRRMSELQDQRFGEEADTIRSEEQAGFYRYAHQRRIGRE